LPSCANNGTVVVAISNPIFDNDRRSVVDESNKIVVAVGDKQVPIGGVSWAFGTRLVPVRDVFMPERVEAFGHFPGKPDQPILRMTIEVRQGIPSFTRVEVAASTGGADITGAHLGQVRDNLDWWLDMIVRHSAQTAAARVRPGVDGWQTVTAPNWADSDAASNAVRQVRRGRPRKATDARHQRVAMIYKAHISGKPREAIQDAFRLEDGTNISPRTAARYVEEARKAGYLPATSQGKRKA
jgi:hypothetical protein